MDANPEQLSQTVDSPAKRAFMRKLAERGWLGMSWPKEYGGQELSGHLRLHPHRGALALRRAAAGQGRRHRRQDDHPPRQREAEARVPAADHARRDRVRDRLQRAERGLRRRQHAAARPRRRAGGWLLNGQKIWTTSAHFADWYWVGARTDPTKKHDGITLFLIPMNHAGLTIRPTGRSATSAPTRCSSTTCSCPTITSSAR